MRVSSMISLRLWLGDSFPRRLCGSYATHYRNLCSKHLIAAVRWRKCAKITEARFIVRASYSLSVTSALLSNLVD
jgi:hypothetical protein